MSGSAGASTAGSTMLHYAIIQAGRLIQLWVHLYIHRRFLRIPSETAQLSVCGAGDGSGDGEAAQWLSELCY